MRRGSSAVAAIVVPLLVLLVVVLVWIGRGGTPPEAEPVPGSAAAALAALPVADAGPMTGYSRAEFGQSWVDVDENGCSTREDVLARDLTDLDVAADGCRVLSGTLRDPYGGAVIEFVRGPSTSAEVQIDHVVALAAAWRTGAADWSPERRREFANDPAELLAVDGGLNQAKSDSDAAQWLPDLDACGYVARQIAVKTTWNLWVTPDERSASAAVLRGCPDEPLPR